MGLKYYSEMNDSPLSEMLRQGSIKTKNQLIGFSDYIWQYCPGTDISTRDYIILYQSVPIDHGKHIPVPVPQSGAESSYNAAFNTGTNLEHFRMLVCELLNKDPDIVPDTSPLIMFDIRSALCMAINGNDSKYTRQIDRRVYFLRNCENCKMHQI